MRSLHIYIVLQLAVLFSQAGNGGQIEDAAEKMQLSKVVQTKAGSTSFTFYDYNLNRKKDSFLVIYDRYDRSGAGVVKKIFYPGHDHTILVSNIPEGKYFITVLRLGIHRQQFQKVLKIKASKCESIELKLEQCDDYSKDRVRIPGQKIDFEKLTIFSSAKSSSKMSRQTKIRKLYKP